MTYIFSGKSVIAKDLTYNKAEIIASIFRQKLNKIDLNYKVFVESLSDGTWQVYVRDRRTQLSFMDNMKLFTVTEQEINQYESREIHE